MSEARCTYCNAVLDSVRFVCDHSSMLDRIADLERKVEVAWNALIEADKSFFLLKRWTGYGMVTEQKAEVLGMLSDTPIKVYEALRELGEKEG